MYGKIVSLMLMALLVGVSSLGAAERVEHVDPFTNKIGWVEITEVSAEDDADLRPKLIGDETVFIDEDKIFHFELYSEPQAMEGDALIAESYQIKSQDGGLIRAKLIDPANGEVKWSEQRRLEPGA